MPTAPAASRAPRDPDATRAAILHAAFLEFYEHGFQAGSLERICRAAGVTKGALFHHFAGKRALGYAVVDEVVGPLLDVHWIAPLAGTDDPLAVTAAAFRQNVHESLASGSWLLGCPLNNLAQEMSPLDAGFQTRLHALYERWRVALAAALERGRAAGTVRATVAPADAAAMIVASQAGLYGTGKHSRDRAVLEQATRGVCASLEALRP